MKNFPFIAFAMLLLLSSCQKETLEDVDKTPKMNAQINGNQWHFTSTRMTVKNGIANLTGTGINNQNTFTVILSDFGETEFFFDRTSAHIAALLKTEYSDEAYTSNNSVSADGTFVIEELNKKEKWISGTFEYYLYNRSDTIPTIIEKGKFEYIPYEELTNNISANINGNSWNPSNLQGNKADGLIEIKGIDPNSQQSLVFQIPETITYGEYPISSLTNIKSFYHPNNETVLDGHTGTIKILKHDTGGRNIEAQFSFEALENEAVHRINNGKFYINY